MYFWYLTYLEDVNADGTVIAGYGYNPDGWQEGFIVDMKKLWVCHAPSGHPENARTLGVEYGSVGDHLAHGDFLGTCEFLNSGGLSRASSLRSSLNRGFSPDPNANKRVVGANANANPMLGAEGLSSRDYSYGKQLGRPYPTRAPRAGAARSFVKPPAPKPSIAAPVATPRVGVVKDVSTAPVR